MRSLSLAWVVVLGSALAACAATTEDEAASTSTGAATTPAPTGESPASSSGGTTPTPPITFGDLTFNAYHSQDAIHTYLSSEATKHPDFVSFAKLGVSRQGRAIEYIALANKDPASLPAIYLNGTHHGDEWSSTESILALADYMIANRSSPSVKAILDSYAIYLQPLVNPDGHLAKTREDSQGNDPNRDYAYPGGSTSEAFQLPEIQLVRDLLAKIKPHGAAAYHSGIQEVLWSWCYTSNEAPEAATLEAAGKSTAQAMGFDRYLQSYDDYATTGEFIDYAYQQYSTLALTFEVSTVKTPAASQLDGIVRNSIKGALAFIAAVEARDAAPPSTAAPDTGTTHSNGRRGSLGAFGVRTTPRLE